MPAKASHSTEPPGDPKASYDRLRSLLTECVQLLGRHDTEGTPQPAPAPPPDLSAFNARELDFLRFVRHPECWPYPYIALRMGLKLPTLHYLRRKLFGKLKVTSRTALALKVRDWALGGSTPL
ncbi:MAG: hypothetical protein IPL77_16785 [Flavobacteriales bacterium]|nr:hypothetical protein [Flavobacteriales bacterium]